MTSSRHSIAETLRRLKDFTATIGSFAVREGQIDYAEKLARSQAQESREEGRSRVEAETEAARAEIAEWRGEALAAVDSVYRARSATVERAKRNVRRQVLEGIEESEGRRKYELQRRMMESARERDRNVAAARTELEAKQADFLDFEARFDALRDDALSRFRGFPGLRRRLQAAAGGEDSGRDRAVSLDAEALQKWNRRAAGLHRRVRANLALGLFARVPVWALAGAALALGAALYLLGPRLGIPRDGPLPAVLLAAAAPGVVLILVYAMMQAAAGGLAARLSKCLRQGFRLREEGQRRFEEALQERIAAFEEAHRRVEEAFRSGIQESGTDAGKLRVRVPEQVDEKADRILGRLQARRDREAAEIEASVRNRLGEIERNRDAALAEWEGAGDGTDFDAQRAALAEQWRTQSAEQLRHLSEMAEAFDCRASWLHRDPDHWSPPEAFPEELVFGKVHYRFDESGARLPRSQEMSLPHDGAFELPLRLLFPAQGSLLIETGQGAGRDEAIACLNQVVGGLLASSPPGRLSFSLVDPVGLGESFAGLMHLADYEEHLINSRIRTQPSQIEERLGELCEYMEKVIQMYLRNEYASISEYNRVAGTVAEKYHFLVVADFPRQFTDEAARRLRSIAQSGARCGVFTLIHHDGRSELPAGFAMEDLRAASASLRATAAGFVAGGEAPPGSRIELFAPPPNDLFLRWIHRIGEANRDSNRIEVPFSQIAPAPEQLWSRRTSGELRVPIGRTGATKLQELAIGQGTRQHALVAGKTGSGKSTLFHVMITNLALWCDPTQVEFYLIDFKKGVEFKAYATHRLPHARVIAIESDREFGLSVLERLDEELKERGEKFRALGAQDIPGYLRAGGTDPIPRTLLLIDEFQEFFVEDDSISQQAAVLLDRVVRQGRAFGIHAILGSQTLGGAFTLARATLGQMVIRIALQCNEADAYLIMDDNNPAPRLLTRPGEGIYNDAAGAPEANSPFQVVWLEDAERERRLREVTELARDRSMDGLPRVVFEGNAPADIAADSHVNDCLRSGDFGPQPRWFLGAPNSIKAPTGVLFERQSGSNLLFVGQRDDVVEGLVAIGLHLLIRQLGDRGRFLLVDGRLADPGGQSWLGEAMGWLGDRVECLGAHEMGEVIANLAGEVRSRVEGEPGDGRITFLFVLGLQKYRKLRYEEDFSFSLDEDAAVKPADALNEIITEGPGVGVHTVLSIDTYNSLNRCLSRKAMAEFEKKVLFQMSAADSASLIDSSRAGNLGMNRAIYYNEPTGVAETFRPYARPGREWFG